jgi:nitrite reductase/ring-hydroxylating ferredoxin subunit
MGEVRVAAFSEVAEGRIVPVEAEGRKLLLARVGDTIYAAGRKCPHLGFNLCRGGKLDGAAIVCPLHKAKFDLASGKIQRDPRLLFFDMKAKGDLPVYPVRIDGDAVMVTV